MLQAIGGSTNGVVHLSAIAGRTNTPLSLEEFDEIGKKTPVLVDLKPSGDHYMEHFHYAGGVPRLMQELKDLLKLDAKHVMGGTLGDAIKVFEDCARPDRDPAAQCAVEEGRRHGDPARQSRAARRRHQAGRGLTEADAARGPRGGVRIGRGHDEPHRRSGARRSARTM